MSKCKCSLSISVLGDGCRYCQPQEQIDSLADALAEETAKADHAEELASAAADLCNFLLHVGVHHLAIPRVEALLAKVENYREETE